MISDIVVTESKHGYAVQIRQRKESGDKGKYVKFSEHKKRQDAIDEAKLLRKTWGMN